MKIEISENELFATINLYAQEKNSWELEADDARKEAKKLAAQVKELQYKLDFIIKNGPPPDDFEKISLIKLAKVKELISLCIEEIPDPRRRLVKMVSLIRDLTQCKLNPIKDMLMKHHADLVGLKAVSGSQDVPLLPAPIEVKNV